MSPDAAHTLDRHTPGFFVSGDGPVDFPRRIIYWMTDDKSLHAKIEGTLGGKPASEEWTWRRIAL